MAVLISFDKFDYTQLNFNKFRNPDDTQREVFPKSTENTSLADIYGDIDPKYGNFRYGSKDPVFAFSIKTSDNSLLSATIDAGDVLDGFQVSGIGLGKNFSGSSLAGIVTGFGFYTSTDSDAPGITPGASFLDFDTRVYANTILKVMKTRSTADDIDLVESLYSKNDIILLWNYADKARGYGGDDVIRGYGGADTLYGDSGADDIAGGKGRDHLYGGVGADDFIFKGGETGNLARTRDVIFDFAPRLDDLDLSLIDANSSTVADNRFDFGGTRAGANDVWFARSGNNVIVFGDTNGDARADFAIELRGVTSLSVGDFIL